MFCCKWVEECEPRRNILVLWFIKRSHLIFNFNLNRDLHLKVRSLWRWWWDSNSYSTERRILALNKCWWTSVSWSWNADEMINPSLESLRSQKRNLNVEIWVKLIETSSWSIPSYLIFLIIWWLWMIYLVFNCSFYWGFLYQNCKHWENRVRIKHWEVHLKSFKWIETSFLFTLLCQFRWGSWYSWFDL